jgi:hypothetical protein
MRWCPGIEGTEVFFSTLVEEYLSAKSRTKRAKINYSRDDEIAR